MKINDKEKFSKLDLSNKRNVLPETSEERIQYIIEYMINIKEYVKVEDLSRMLFTSPKTLAGDLKEAEKILNSYSITLERNLIMELCSKGRA